MAESPKQRQADELRPVSVQTGYQAHPAGSVLIRCGGTRVICSVSVEESVPRWMKANQDQRGWLTAEYQMLPGATSGRAQREVSRGRVSGRTAEIQRLIGRSLRAAVDLTRIPGRTLYVDCDVVDADGGTRCAAITGGCIALELALRTMLANDQLRDWPMITRVSAVSVGMVDGEAVLDLCYEQDAAAEVDLNVVMTASGEFVEVQGTAEGRPFGRDKLDAMLELASKGAGELCTIQRDAVKASEVRIKV